MPHPDRPAPSPSPSSSSRRKRKRARLLLLHDRRGTTAPTFYGDRITALRRQLEHSPLSLAAPWSEELFSLLYGTDRPIGPDQFRVYYALLNEQGARGARLRVTESEDGRELLGRMGAHNQLIGADSGGPGGGYDGPCGGHGIGPPPGLSRPARGRTRSPEPDADLLDAEPALSDPTVARTAYTGPALSRRGTQPDTLCVVDAAKDAAGYAAIYRAARRCETVDGARRVVAAMRALPENAGSTSRGKRVVKMWDKMLLKRRLLGGLAARGGPRCSGLILRSNYSERTLKQVCTPRRVLCYQIRDQNAPLPAQFWGPVGADVRPERRGESNGAARVDAVVRRVLAQRLPFRISAQTLNPKSPVYSPRAAAWAAASPLFIDMLVRMGARQRALDAVLAESPRRRLRSLRGVRRWQAE